MADLAITAASVLPTGNTAIDRSGTAGEAISAGQVVYRDTTTRQWMLAQNNGTGTRVPGGIALNSAGAGQPLAVQTAGSITIGAALTVGDAYYLSANAGGICLRADLVAGDDVALIGIASSATVLALNIQAPGVTL